MVEIVGHTCDTCGDMDGNHMPRSEAHAGTTAPPFHPNCRCVIVPYFGDEEETGKRVMRDAETVKAAKTSSVAARSDIILSELGTVVMDSRKFTEYALNPAKDPDIAKAFMLALGYDLSNWQELEEKVVAAIKTSRERQKRETKYGIQYEVILQITGANGKTANVTTGWIKSEDSEEVRMTTVYVFERKAKNES